MKLAALTCLAAVAPIAASAETMRTYHVGNSLTWDVQPSGLDQIATSRGNDHTAGYDIYCSQPLPNIWEQLYAPCVTPNLGSFDSALPGQQWDAVVLQIYRHPSDVTTLAEDVAAATGFIGLTRSNAANAGTTFFIYAAPPGHADYAADLWDDPIANDDDTPTTLSRAYYAHLMARLDAATDAEVRIVPVGEVLWLLDQRMRAGLIDGFDSIADLYRDEIHLSLDVGRYVAAVTHYATLYGDDPYGLTAPSAYGDGSAFTPELYGAIHDAVWDVVTTHPYTGVPEPASLALLAGSAIVLFRRH